MASRTIGACSPGRWVNGTSPAYRSIQLSTGCSIPLSTGGFIRCDASHRRGVVTVPWISEDVGGRPAPAMTLRGRCLMRDVGWSVPSLAGVLADGPMGGDPADIRGVENGALPPCLRLPP